MGNSFNIRPKVPVVVMVSNSDAKAELREWKSPAIAQGIPDDLTCYSAVKTATRPHTCAPGVLLLALLSAVVASLLYLGPVFSSSAGLKRTLAPANTLPLKAVGSIRDYPGRGSADARQRDTVHPKDPVTFEHLNDVAVIVVGGQGRAAHMDAGFESWTSAFANRIFITDAEPDNHNVSTPGRSSVCRICPTRLYQIQHSFSRGP